MPDKNGKPKSSKGTDQSVLGSLPSTRPTRMARKRDGEAEAEPAAKPRSTAAAKPRAAAAKPRAAKPDGPRAVRSGSPSLTAAKGRKPPREQPQPAPPKGAELVTTTVKAAGELAQIGISMGGKAIKRAARRLPKP